MVECFRELDLSFFSITESWLKNDAQTKKEIDCLRTVENIEMIVKNRQRRGGGVLLAFDRDKANFKPIRLKDNNYELLCCEGNIVGVSKKVVVFTVYLPPKMTVISLEAFCKCFSENLDEILLRFPEPMIVFTGDFNRKDVSAAVEDFPELSIIRTDATRGTSHLDLIYTNFNDDCCFSKVLPPLEANNGESCSDHSIVSVTAKFPRIRHVVKKTITFRPYTERGEQIFGHLLAKTEWAFLYQCHDRAAALRDRLDEYTDIAFPLKTRIVRNTDKPWITTEIRQLARRKKREYKNNRRSLRWKVLEEKLERKLKTSRKEFFDRIKKKVAESSNTREYFRAVKMLEEGDGKKDGWTIERMFPSKSNAEIAEHVADYFNSISRDFIPLPQVAPFDASSLCPEVHQIAAKLRSIKKTNSQVPGDINRRLVTKYADLIATPLWIVFEKAFRTSEWPLLWKTETVTVIPKGGNPTELSQLRNLSCTPLFSKVMETFIQDRLKTEVTLNYSQFGGMRGSSVDHFLIESWDRILRGLEDNRAAVTLSSIDFQKAFNRVCHHECLKAATSMGASETTVAMLRAFLTGRVMTVKVGNVKSLLRNVDGGSPQGSILGNHLFCIVTDQLNRCVPQLNPVGNEEPGPDTLSFSENGNDFSLSSTSADLSPIMRPIVSDISLSEESEDDEIRASNFICFNPINRWYDSDLSIIANQDMINEMMGQLPGWTDQQMEIKVYIDDVNAIEKVSQVNAISSISQNKRILKVHAIYTEKFFENVSVKSKEIKMLVNQEKTQILCISAAIYDNVTAYIRPKVDGVVTETLSGPTLRIVGFNFDCSPTVKYHVESMCNKFRAKIWSLRKLKRGGMGQGDMLFIYSSVLRPIVEFACVTYGPMLTADLTSKVEKLQLRAMKIIYGFRVSYRTVLEMTSLQTLQERRDERIRKFAVKTAANPRFAERWFPKNPPPAHNIRKPKIYHEENSRTTRLYNSPLFTMRRILNQIHA